MRWACFGTLGNLPSEGTSVVGYRLVSPAEGAGALGASPFLIRCTASESRL